MNRLLCVSLLLIFTSPPPSSLDRSGSILQLGGRWRLWLRGRLLLEPGPVCISSQVPVLFSRGAADLIPAWIRKIWSFRAGPEQILAEEELLENC
ncbi:hypothetical protein DNTS_010110 [Danionella cerebrum]|uniref:Uncharacterized protein n=1 Tax=Danionella cerebrum TaxID=2873325 RepID=A0A553MM34_9TELE|nr:hypothetical protein DNTS_010110 [Danionella translucida]